MRGYEAVRLEFVSGIIAGTLIGWFLARLLRWIFRA